MPTSSDHELDLWIAARKQDLSAHLAPLVMGEIQKASEPIHPLPEAERPSRLLAAACLAAGIGKLSLIVHLVF
jgi:hypothetical protein